MGISRTLHLKNTQSPHSFPLHVEHSLGVHHIPGYKTSLNKSKSMDITSGIFPWTKMAKELGINHRKRNEENKLHTRGLNNKLLKTNVVDNEIKEEIKKHF